ncbi:tRNA dimethylallyltransferase [Sarracenia purpurea var. burkii]
MIIVPPVFKLDGTNVDEWYEKVEKNAFNIVENYLNGTDMLSLDYTPLPSQTADPSRYQDGEHYCDTCDRVFIGNGRKFSIT